MLKGEFEMVITVVVSICHALSNVPQPVCREEIIIKDRV